MYPDHRETIERATAYFAAQPQVRGLLLGGSIAHGFAQASSDVDVLIIVAPDEYQRRVAASDVLFLSHDLATYAGGYVDGKYLSEDFLADVALRGSEPARFAFADAQILLSHIDGLAEQLQRIVRYPREEKLQRIQRFSAQLEAWYWYASEADKKANPYLLGVAVQKLLLFGGRLILAHNEQLYPYHKWFLAVLAQAQHKPEGLLELMESLSRAPSYAGATRFYTLIKEFRAWETETTLWPNRFMLDSELTWMHGPPAIDDL